MPFLRNQEYVEPFSDHFVRMRAQEKNCDIQYSDDRTLLLDLDSPEALEFFRAQWDMLEDIWSSETGGLLPWNYQTRKSRNGNTHVVVTLDLPYPIEKRIMLQAVLGSDRKRDLLSWLGWRAGQKNPICLFIPRTGTPPSVEL